LVPHVASTLWLIPALPLAGAAVNTFFGNRLGKWAGVLSTVLVFASFGVSLAAVLNLLTNAGEDRLAIQHLFDWISVGGFQVGADLRLDTLSATMILVITGIGGLIHLYSIGYMAEDPRRGRFFAYMNLFVFFMLMLVLGANYLVLYLGWEGVGLCSYLLIGFWYSEPANAEAAKKAFITTRIGDTLMLIGLALLVFKFGTLDYEAIFGTAGSVLTKDAATVIALLLFAGAIGKSAQLPLQVWLPDAMAGPTLVSALIHAATMVTAGVYLVVRSSFIYDYTQAAQTAVVVVGTVTLLWGAVIGCAKDDIKKALAGSTMSQIGYMMLAAGLGPAGYAFAIFHLLTHGFFKANMFLGAGSVMHAMDDDVDMRHYGALAKAVPVTFVTFAMGYLAIIGIPPFAGFWSKDKIIEAALADNPVAGIAALVGAGITAFYMTRVMLMTFGGKRRWLEGVHPHESPAVMTGPLVALGALSALGGLLLLGGWVVDWLAPVVGAEPEGSFGLPAIVVSLIALAVVIVGIVIAWLTVGRHDVPATAPQRVSVVTRAARADLYGDAFNEAMLMRPGDELVNGLLAFDRQVVDSAVMGSGGAFGLMSSSFRRVQTGFVRSYALSLLGGALVVLVALLVVNL
ncbi:MAG TPA: NADH-quinone oxidoreductase subunit L, partial [Nocardioidaceae bacterium]|nr:NADH-quinone oxidoreductase subunit L [Nocardioidaceae bacterium]